VEFLRGIRATLQPGDGCFIGIDLRKDRAALEAAYDDPCGVTAAFNLNMLGRINRQLGGDFELRSFRHCAVYDEAEGRVEMYLVSAIAQRIHLDWLGLDVEFASGEAIHTENSYKYSIAEIDSLAERAGLRVAARWLDDAGQFSSNLMLTN